MKIFTAMLLSLLMSPSVTGSQAARSGPEAGASLTPNWVVAQATTQQPVAPAPGTNGTAKRRLTERQSFNVARFVNTCAAYRLFLEDHPAGEFESQARRWIKQKCRSKRAGDEPSQPAAERGAPDSAVNSSSSSSDRKAVRGGRATKPKTVRRKPKRVRKKPRTVRKKRVVKPKATVKRARRPRVKRCRLETNWECVRRGGQMEFGACNRERICE